jgi:hypothetical protein
VHTCTHTHRHSQTHTHTHTYTHTHTHTHTHMRTHMHTHTHTVNELSSCKRQQRGASMPALHALQQQWPGLQLYLPSQET